MIWSEQNIGVYEMYHKIYFKYVSFNSFKSSYHIIGKTKILFDAFQIYSSIDLFQSVGSNGCLFCFCCARSKRESKNRTCAR